MPVPFQDAEDLETIGAAAYLKLETEPSGAGYRGALFVVNARGEPLEFAYNRVELPETSLWRRADLRRHAERSLATSLFAVCNRTPRLLLCLADEVQSELFCQDLRVALPVARIGQPLAATSFAAGEAEEAVAEPEPLQLFWFPAPPAPESAERALFDRLRTRGLLLEPFDRAATGLREVYDE
jgi:hypothetical protein